MNVHYYGQSAFRLSSEDGLNIVIDPYDQSSYLRYEPRFESADICLVTHEHGDHNNVAAVPGDFEVVRGPGQHVAKEISFTGIPSFHDRQQGAQRGPNNMFVFEVEGMRVAHLGDQGVELTDDQYNQLGHVDVMIAAIGGGPTLEPEKVWEIVGRVKPKVFIPAHFKTEKIDLPFITVDEFIQDKPRVRRPGGSDVTITKDQLPEETEIVVLDPSR